MKKSIHISTFLLFLALLFLPLAQEQMKLFNLPSLNENRNRVKVPGDGRANTFLLERIYNDGVNFTAAYERAYNDSYGFRDSLILAKNQLDYSVFNHSDDILIGKDGYLFFRSMIETDLVRAERITDDQLNKTLNNLVRFNSFLNNRGMKLVVVLCRDKESIYSDLITSPTATRPAKVRSDYYLDFLSKQNEILYLDSREVLTKAREISPVYYKTDFHWNAVGASYMGRRIVNYLARTEGLSPLWTSAPSISERPDYSGTQNLYLATFFAQSETAYEVAPKLQSRFQLATQPNFPFEYYSTSTTSKHQIIPKTVIIGNSFTPYLFKTDFPAFFKEVGYIFKGHLRVTPIENLLPVGTRYVILQVNEFDLGTYYNSDEVWNFLNNDQSHPE